MTNKELEEHFTVFKKNGVFYLHNKEAGKSRMNYKYLCSAIKHGTKFSVEGLEPTGNIEVLKTLVQEYVNQLPYNSEYYYPFYREGVFEELIIHDYLNSLGLKNKHDEVYTLVQKDIFGLENGVSLFFYGLDTFNGVKEEVTVNLHTGLHSWVSVSCKRNVEDIKEAINSIVKPLMLSQSFNALSVADKIKDSVKDIEEKLLDGNLNTQSQKLKLKQKLQSLLEKL